MSTTDNYHRHKDHLTPPSASLIPIFALSTVLRKVQIRANMVKDRWIRSWGEMELSPEKPKMIITDQMRPTSTGSPQASDQILQMLLFVIQQAFQSHKVQNINLGITSQGQSKETLELQQPLNKSLRQPCDQKEKVKSKGKSSSVNTNSFKSETKGFGSKQSTNNTNTRNAFGQLRDCDLALAKLGYGVSLSKFNRSSYLRASSKNSNANYHNSELGILPVLSWVLQVKNITELLLSQAHAIKSLISLIITVRYLVLSAVLEKLQPKDNFNHKTEKVEKVSHKVVVLSMAMGGNMNFLGGEGEMAPMDDFGEVPHDGQEGDHYADDEEMQEVPNFQNFSDDDEDEFENRMNQGAQDGEEFDEVFRHLRNPGFLDGRVVPQFENQASPHLNDRVLNEPMDAELLEAILNQLAEEHQPIPAPPQHFLREYQHLEQISFQIPYGG